jgi:hypothetical protein
VRDCRVRAVDIVWYCKLTGIKGQGTEQDLWAVQAKDRYSFLIASNSYCMPLVLGWLLIKDS